MQVELRELLLFNLTYSVAGLLAKAQEFFRGQQAVGLNRGKFKKCCRAAMVIENLRNFFVAALDDLINFQIALMGAHGMVSVDAVNCRKYPLAKSFQCVCPQF